MVFSTWLYHADEILCVWQRSLQQNYNFILSNFSKNILCFITDSKDRVRVMKAYSGVELQRHLFLSSALDRGDWSALCPRCYVVRSKNALFPVNISGRPKNHKQKLNHGRGFRLPSRWEWHLHSSGMLHSLDWWLVADVSHNVSVTDCLTIQDGSETSSLNVGKYVTITVGCVQHPWRAKFSTFKLGTRFWFVRVVCCCEEFDICLWGTWL
jgi:hypothetical protein